MSTSSVTNAPPSTEHFSESPMTKEQFFEKLSSKYGSLITMPIDFTHLEKAMTREEIDQAILDIADQISNRGYDFYFIERLKLSQIIREKKPLFTSESDYKNGLVKIENAGKSTTGLPQNDPFQKIEDLPEDLRIYFQKEYAPKIEPTFETAKTAADFLVALKNEYSGRIKDPIDFSLLSEATSFENIQEGIQSICNQIMQRGYGPYFVEEFQFSHILALKNPFIEPYRDQLDLNQINQAADQTQNSFPADDPYLNKDDFPPQLKAFMDNYPM